MVHTQSEAKRFFVERVVKRARDEGVPLSDAGAKDAWQQALSVLDQGDHYIGIMIDRAVGARLKLKKWWQFRWS